MQKTPFVQAVDEIQRALRPFMQQHGFRLRGRTFNRITSDGLTHVVNFQMGRSDPPGTVPIPGYRENMYGLFTVNVGVYVPEVGEKRGLPAKTWVQEYDCCLRSRLGELVGAKKDLWWPARHDDRVIEEIRRCIEDGGLPFFDSYSSRDGILDVLADCSRDYGDGGGNPSRIICAIIHAGRGDKDRAREYLSRQLVESRDNPGHRDYVRQVAEKLGLQDLEV